MNKNIFWYHEKKWYNDNIFYLIQIYFDWIKTYFYIIWIFSFATYQQPYIFDPEICVLNRPFGSRKGLQVIRAVKVQQEQRGIPEGNKLLLSLHEIHLIYLAKT